MDELITVPYVRGMHEDMLERTHERFRTTSWTLIDDLRDGSPERHDRAAKTLFHRYWPAAYAFLRQSGRGRDDAAELVQGFFAEVVVGRNLLERADRGRGRLRTFVITALKNYARDRHRQDVARRREDQISIDDLEHEDAFLSRERDATPARAFEIFEAKAVLEETMDRCRRHFERIDKHAHWAAFRAAVIRPAISGCDPPPLTDVATELGFASATHVASVFKVARKRFRILLREVAAESAQDPDDQEAEYRRIVELLG